MPLNLEALDQLDRVARESPDDDNFDMGTLDCESAHCLLGWAELDPWFADKPYTVVELLGLSGLQSDALFGYGTGGGDSDFYTPAKGKAIKAEVVANLGRLRRGKRLVAYTGSIYRRDHGATPIPGTGAADA